ncbi:MAG: GTPase HflX, partial [Bacteroidales bacterium]
DKPTYLIFNKIDAYSYMRKDEDDLSPKTKQNFTLKELKNTWIAKNNSPCMFISATEKENIVELKEMLYKEVKKIHITRYPYDDFLY